MDLIAVLLHSEASDRPKGINIHLIMVENILTLISISFDSIKSLTVETFLPLTLLRGVGTTKMSYYCDYNGRRHPHLNL